MEQEARSTTGLLPIRGVFDAAAPATGAVSNEVHDLVQLLSKKADGVWRDNRYVADAVECERCRSLFEQIKQDDVRHRRMLRGEIDCLCRTGAFQ